MANQETDLTQQGRQSGFWRTAGMFFSLRGEGNGAASSYMLIGVIGFSLVPLLIAVFGRDAPILFTGGLRIGSIIGYLLFLVFFYRSLFFNLNTWRQIARRIVSSPLQVGGRVIYSPFPILLASITYLDYTFFALSTQYIDVAVATVFYETWPIFLIALTGFLFRNDGSYEVTTREVYILSLLCLTGFAFVVLSQNEEVSLLAEGLTPSQMVIGFAFLAMALVLAPLAAFGLRWGVDLGNGLAEGEGGNRHQVGELHLFGAVTANLVGNIIAFGVLGSSGSLFTGETLTPTFAVFAVIGGILSLSVANIAWRKANLVTHDLGINVLSYLTPIFGVLWLFVFSQVGVARPDFLIIGTIAIVVANLIINFGAERLLGFKALIIALWLCGTMVYLRPDAWLFKGEVEYYGIIGLSATVFTLLLSFRIARLSSRIQNEDHQTFRLVRELDALARRGVVRHEICENVLTINQASGPEMQQAYEQARESMEEALRQASPQDEERLVAMEVELDSLTHSRQQGINFGELCALGIFGIITVAITLLARPDAEGVTAFLVEVFTIMFSAVILFLTVGIGDLEIERISRIMQSHSSSVGENHKVLFRDETKRHIEQVITIAVGLFIVTAFTGLLGYKWLGWFG